MRILNITSTLRYRQRCQLFHLIRDNLKAFLHYYFLGNHGIPILFGWVLVSNYIAVFLNLHYGTSATLGLPSSSTPASRFSASLRFSYRLSDVIMDQNGLW